MSSYITRFCHVHGEWEMDVDGSSDCPECEQAGTTPVQEARKKARRQFAQEAVEKWDALMDGSTDLAHLPDKLNGWRDWLAKQAEGG